MSMSNIFRDAPLPERRSGSNTNGTAIPLADSMNRGTNYAFAPVSSSPPPLNRVNGPTPPPTMVASPSPVASAAAPATSMPSTGANSSTYANVGGSTSGKISIVPYRPMPPQSRKFVLINAEDQRIDMKLPPPSSAAIQSLESRIKSSKICNNHHLLGKCANPGCGYTHGTRIPVPEQLALRHKARERVCQRGGDCRNPDCLSGHMCPRNERCEFKNTCYFEGLHHLDTIPKMRQYASLVLLHLANHCRFEDGDVEILSRS